MGVTYYPIREDLARRAHDLMSFSDYQEGRATTEYRALVDIAVETAERQKKRVDPMYHAKIDGLLDLYARKLADVINKDNEIGTRCPSVMISGGSNFPVRKKQKQNAAWDKNREAWENVNGILDKIKSTGRGGISADDPGAVAKLREKLESREVLQARMKAANAAVRMKDTTKGDAKLAELGYSVEAIQRLREPDYCGRVGFPSYELTNNNAEIRRLRGRIAELEKRESEPAPEDWEFDGGSVVANTELNRLQILFDDKPDEDVRAELKSNGFKWAPSQKAWQRQLTPNAMYAARRIKAIAPVTKGGERDG